MSDAIVVDVMLGGFFAVVAVIGAGRMSNQNRNYAGSVTLDWVC